MHKAVSNPKIISQLQSSCTIQHSTNATMLWVPADIFCSSPTNMGHIHTLIKDNICKLRSCKQKASKHHDLKLLTC